MKLAIAGLRCHIFTSASSLQCTETARCLIQSKSGSGDGLLCGRVFVLNDPPTAKVILRQGRSLKSYLTQTGEAWNRTRNPCLQGK